ncbi:uncharacterized protein (TIGR00375 family) [Pullulanibacillus pueri]|uniref:TIGR00375 family protein n=1 Tax=Pullulanibacillus pueri TaxID=1437324 RepID=A0A8J2ZUG6_9BACL|nr:endonuclease Q family protein [Pullulanibacillus pueri]MBM7681661.1 uncharacterized protein (TIGR00375 family) [Pullulanibacillus pueri]GGH79266.1 hypothetical protein GCM10007096_13930 [Pullulanibacillus pueri]
MQDFYADLHIHIGRTRTGRPVKITGSRTLTIDRILEEASLRKGLDIVGVIDCHVPEVLDEIEAMKESGRVCELQEGGLRFEKVTLILGCEIEVKDAFCQGPIHVLAYLPTLKTMRAFSEWLGKHVTNNTLSTQRFFGYGKEIQEKVKDLGGLFIPAHVFTPFKSVYGVGVKQSISEILDPDLIDAIELGLSSDTEMADQLEELHRYPFVTNSDAHSLKKIAREYQTFRLEQATFTELSLALKHKEGRDIVANYGLNPRLGKYHRTRCAACLSVIEAYHQGDRCPDCGHKRVVKGVRDRLEELKSAKTSGPHRPPYIHQVPLEFIPKLGPKTLEKLLVHFGTEMNVLHQATAADLTVLVGPSLSQLIIAAREGTLAVETGGAGRYGRVTMNSEMEK